MIIDCRAKPNSAATKDAMRRQLHCFLDGRRIDFAWYADTEAGIVKTYDVMGDGNVRRIRKDSDIPAIVEAVKAAALPQVLEMLDHGLMSKTLTGKVELRPCAS